MMIGSVLGPLVALGLLCIVHGKTITDNKKNEDRATERDLHMSLDAQQTLYEEFDLDGLNKLQGRTTPVYRMDLPADYIAYWEVAYNQEYIIVSAGPHTGDNDIVSRGENQLPSNQLRDEARQRGATCHRFYLMASSGDMMCEDIEHRVVATTIPEEVLLNELSSNLTEIDIATLDHFVRSRQMEQTELWRKHAAELEWGDSEENQDEDEEEEEEEEDGDDGDGFKRVRVGPPKDQDESPEDEEGNSSEQKGDEEEENNSSEQEGDDEEDGRQSYDQDGTFSARPVIPGTPVRIITGRPAAEVEIHLRYIAAGSKAVPRLARMSDHTKLCKVVKGCKLATKKHAVISKEAQDSSAIYFDLELGIDTRKVFKNDDFVFAVDIVQLNGEITTTRHFSVQYRPRREKRSTKYKPWSSWSPWSIQHKQNFPHYNQFKHGSCAVGCGPVAWAMVFGYYDRTYSKSSALYRSGGDGTSGSSSTVAPKYNDNRMKGYIQRINKELGTFCLFGGGATLASKMPKIRNFYVARQTGNPYITQKRSFWTFAGRYSDSVRDWTEARLKEQWPVIIGWRIGSYFKFTWHYPVATELKMRTRLYKRCLWRICGRWRTAKNREIYLHMGWGGSRDRWVNLDAYYAITAKFNR